MPRQSDDGYEDDVFIVKRDGSLSDIVVMTLSEKTGLCAQKQDTF